MKHFLYSIIFLILQINQIEAQTNSFLSYEDAVKMGLQHNLDVMIAKNEAEISSIQNNLGNAGFYPKVDMQMNLGGANNATNQKFSSGQTVNKASVISGNFSSGVYVTYTLFDGYKMFATKKKLEILEEQGEINFKIQAENLVEKLSLTYYQIVRQEQMLNGILSSMDVADARLQLAEKKLLVGSGSNVEVLQAKLDLNALKSNFIANKNALKEQKIAFSQLIQDKEFSNFQVDTNFYFEQAPVMEQLYSMIDQKNKSLLFTKKNQEISAQIIREIKSQKLPKLDLNSNLLFSRNQNAAGFSLLNQNAGFNAGIAFYWNLFNGYQTRNQLKIAEINQLNSRLMEDNLRIALYASIKTVYEKWYDNKQALELEEQNIQLARQSLTIMLERMKVGLGNYLETKESQNAYEQAITRLVNARYNLKEAEIILKKVTGQFIQ
ncbi:MAG: TolC family protein [Chitinophagaceae bacterium]|nr:MAG: outer membrane efflux protein [Bacteroidetes bacterium OLB11]MCC6447584.1 TolC family protein [Chitinophagaceae bacterium]HMN33570.1 TolC family protein [Chitinophagaceae bacterium]